MLAVSTTQPVASAAPPASADDVVVQWDGPPVTVVEVVARYRSARQTDGRVSPTVRELRAFVEEVLVAERALAREAVRRGLAEAPHVRFRLGEALARAIVDVEAARVRKERPVTDSEVAEAYRQRVAAFQAPEQIRVGRILLATEAEAMELRATLGPRPTLDAFRAAARDRSLDKATHLRGGDLGFLSADGASSFESFRADPALFAAAERLKDGELGARAVREGDHYALVWRRGTKPASRVALDEASAGLRRVLEEERTERHVKEWLDAQMASRVGAVDDSLLAGLPAYAADDAPRF
jgi:peptidyl-prolyl cis-trans isomerase C